MPPRSSAPRTWEQYARDLGVELQRLRIEAGLTQEALAHRCGLTRNHYQNMEKGWWREGVPANPSLRVVLRLAQVLGVDPGDLLPPVSALTWPDGDG